LGLLASNRKQKRVVLRAVILVVRLLTMMLLRPISRVVARPQRRTFIDWMTNYPDRVSPVHCRRLPAVDSGAVPLCCCCWIILRKCGPAAYSVRSLVALFASFANSFLTNVRYCPTTDFGVEEGPSSGRKVRLYLAETAKRQVDGRPGWSFLCGRIDSADHWSLSIGDRKGQDGVIKVRKCFARKLNRKI
jgi:hypothetical protein